MTFEDLHEVYKMVFKEKLMVPFIIEQENTHKKKNQTNA